MRLGEPTTRLMISAKKNDFIIEMRPDCIRVARVSFKSQPVVIESILEQPLKPGAEGIAEALRTFAGVKGNAYLNGACAIYPTERILRHLSVDASRGKEGEFVLDFIRSQVGVDPANYAVFCLSAQDGKDAELAAFNKKPVLLCGVSRQEVATLQESLVSKGIYPTRLEMGSIGIIGAVKDLLAWQDEACPALFLEIERDSATAVIVGSKGVEMARRIDCGSDEIAQSLKEEMNLKDVEAAHKLLWSRDFDLGTIAGRILRRLMRELQSSIGFFEVQTGQSISKLHCMAGGKEVGWLRSSICDLLNLTPLKIDIPAWLASRGVTISDGVDRSRLDMTWLGLLALACELEKERAA